MKNKGKHTMQRCLVLFVMTIYFLIASTNIFFLQRTTSLLTNTHSSILFKKKVESVFPNNFMERTDKATFKETIKGLVQTTPVLYLDFLFTDLKTTDLQATYPSLNSLSFYNHRYAYLSFSIFKI